MPWFIHAPGADRESPHKLSWKLIFTLPSPKQKQWEIRSKLTFPLGYLSYSVFYALILLATEKSQNIYLRKSNTCSTYSWHVETWGDLTLKPEISPIKKVSVKIILYVCLQGCLKVLFKSLTGNERIVYPLLIKNSLWIYIAFCLLC